MSDDESGPGKKRNRYAGGLHPEMAVFGDLQGAVSAATGQLPTDAVSCTAPPSRWSTRTANGGGRYKDSFCGPGRIGRAVRSRTSLRCCSCGLVIKSGGFLRATDRRQGCP